MKPVLPRLLVIDDEPELGPMIAGTLAGVFTVIICEPSQALACVARGGFELVMTDVQMPQMTALAILQAVRKSWPQVRVVLMSGNSRGDPLVQALLAQGAVDVLPKPLPHLPALSSILLKHLKA